MAKPALGKGLNQLMSGQRVAQKAVAPDAEKVTPVDFGRGLSTLVTPPVPEPADATEKRLLLPAWFFFAADLLLLAYTVAICLDAEGSLQMGEIVFAFFSVSLGALLAIMGVLRLRERSIDKLG